MKTHRHLLRLAILAALLPAAAGASEIGYQGRVVAGGTNYDGTGYFKFAFVNQSESLSRWSNDGTSIAGSEPSNAVPLTVTKGLFSVQLGDTFIGGMTSNIFPSILAAYDVYLKVWFSPSNSGFTALSPNLYLPAGPAYATYAEEAYAVRPGGVTSSQIGEGQVTSFCIADGAVGEGDLGDNSISAVKLQLGAVTSDKLADGSVTAPKIANGAVSALGSPNGSLTNVLVTDNSGNVGIGTGSNALTSALAVSGTVSATAFSGDGSLLTGLPTNSLVQKAGDTMSGPLTNQSSITANSFSGDGSDLTGLSAGNIGTGILADARLSTNVALLSGSPVFQGYVAALSNTVVDPLGVSSGTLDHALVFGNPSGGQGIVSKYTAGGNQFGLDFYAGTAPRMNISSVGNVGIGFGTNVPTNKLQVNGIVSGSSFAGSGANITSINATNITAGTLADARLSTNVALLTGSPSFAGSLTVNNVSNNQVAVQVTSTNTIGTWMAIDNSTTGGQSWRLVSTASGNGEGAGHLLVIENGPGVRMMISSNGNVGVGTTTPTNKLHVAGNVQASGTVIAGNNVMAGAFFAVAQSSFTPTNGATLFPTTGYVQLNPTSNVSLSGSTAINGGTFQGEYLILEGNNSNTTTVPDNANTSLSSNIALSARDTLQMIWNGGQWVEVAHSNN